MHGVVENLRDLWYARHNFHLTGTRIVADSTFCRIFRGLHRTPKTLHVILLEQMKFQSSLNTDADFTGMVLPESGFVRKFSVTHSAVKNAHEMWMRIRCLMSTIAFCMIEDKTWLPYEKVESFMDYLNDLMFNRLDDKEPDLAFFNRAYLCTMNEWQQTIRNGSVSLGTLIEQRSVWSHYWTNYSPSSSSSSRSLNAGPSGHIDMAMLPPDLVQKINNSWSLVRSLQSKGDNNGAANRPARDNDDGDDGKHKKTKKAKGFKKRGGGGGNGGANRGRGGGRGGKAPRT